MAIRKADEKSCDSSSALSFTNVQIYLPTWIPPYIKTAVNDKFIINISIIAYLEGCFKCNKWR